MATTKKRNLVPIKDRAVKSKVEPTRTSAKLIKDKSKLTPIKDKLVPIKERTRSKAEPVSKTTKTNSNKLVPIKDRGVRSKVEQAISATKKKKY